MELKPGGSVQWSCAGLKSVQSGEGKHWSNISPIEDVWFVMEMGGGGLQSVWTNECSKPDVNDILFYSLWCSTALCQTGQLTKSFCDDWKAQLETNTLVTESYKPMVQTGDAPTNYTHRPQTCCYNQVQQQLEPLLLDYNPAIAGINWDSAERQLIWWERNVRRAF